MARYVLRIEPVEATEIEFEVSTAWLDGCVDEAERRHLIWQIARDHLMSAVKWSVALPSES